MKEALELIVSRSNPDVIFMSCTNLRVLKALEGFETLFKRPIVSSNTALFWHAMTLAGKKVECPGFGKLLSP